MRPELVPEPGIGAVVHYVARLRPDKDDPGIFQHVPAIVVVPFDPAEPDASMVLRVFRPTMDETRHVYRCDFDPGQRPTAGSWHLPEPARPARALPEPIPFRRRAPSPTGA